MMKCLGNFLPPSSNSPNARDGGGKEIKISSG
jgi:hypothetical protein